jgi:hypothetical protein
MAPVAGLEPWGHVAAPKPSPIGCEIWHNRAHLLSLVHRGTRSVGYQQVHRIRDGQA